MASSVKLPVTQVGLEQSIQQALKNAGKNSQINLGTNSRQINALSQPLGRITGQADEFTKSMEAANARVFAFGASVGIINGVTSAFAALVKNTIATEKALVDININLKQSSKELDKFGNDLFNLAKNTGQSFQTVAEGALELSRQGLAATDVVKRLNDALILSRLSGLSAQQSVEGLTAAINSYTEAGISSEQILNKLVVVSQKYAVSERDLIEGLKRSASVANQAGVSFDELVGIITTVQERTARGGAVIGNAFKTIFSKIQDKGALQDLQDLGIQVTDAAGKILPATSILQNLGKEFDNLSQLQQTDIAKKLGGIYQLSNLLAAVKDLSSEQSKYGKIVELSQNAADEAYQKNIALNNTLAAIINKVSITAQQLSVTLGNLGVTDNLKNLLNFFGGLLESFQKILGEESAIGGFVRGLAKGLGNLITGPGFALFGAIILKLSKDLVQFGFASLKSFFGIGKAVQDIANVEKSINAALATNIGLQQKLFALEGNRSAQLRVITDALIQQEAVIRRSASISKDLAAPSYRVGVRATSQGLRVPPSAAGGYMPAMQKEASDINKGVGGARSGDRPVAIPNFNFGGGKKGSIVANTGEYAIPNFAGSGGTAIFNRNMVQKMGLPAGAKKINAAGGLVPNFAAPKDLFVDLVGLSQGTVQGEWNSFSRDNPNLNLQNKKYAYADLYKKDGVKETYLNWRSSGERSLQRRIKEEESSELLQGNYSSNIALLYPSSKERTGFVTTKGGNTIKVASVVSQPDDFLYKELRKSFINTSRNYVKNIGINPDVIDDQKFLDIANKTLNEGTLQAAVGNVFETALQAASGVQSKKSNANFDIAGEGSVKQFAGSFKSANGLKPNSHISDVLNKVTALDFKNALNSSNIDSFDSKIKNAIGMGEIKTPKLENKASGYIPNFASESYITDTLKRIKEGSSGFSKQEQEIFLKKFGASASFGNKGISLRKVFDSLDSESGISAMVDKAYSAAGPTASSDQVFQTFSKQIAANPESLRRLVKQKGFVPNFADSPINLSKTQEQIESQRKKSFKARTYRKASGTIGTLFKTLPEKFFADGVLGDSGQGIETDGIFQIVKNSALYASSFAGPNAVKFVTQAETYGLKVSKSLKDKLAKLAVKAAVKTKGVKGYAEGFFPNFADPLKEAIGREMAAGVPSSQIYIDKNPSLKNAANPMGLMVANRRDEPMGGQQGISRAIKEGRNPKTYGAADGFVPNYAAGDTGTASGGVSKVLVGLFAFQTAVSVATGFLEEAGDSGKRVAETLQKVAATALIFGGIAFSAPVKKLKEFADELAKARKAVRDSSTDGFSKGYRSGKVGNPTINLNTTGKLGGVVGRGVAGVKKTASDIGEGVAEVARRAAASPIGRGAVAIGRGVGTVGRGVGTVAGTVGRGVGAAGVALGGLLGPATLAIGAFKIAGEAASGFRTYSNAAAKSLGEMSVYANKATQSLSELDRAAIESQSNKSYGYSFNSLVGSLQNIVGASSVASAYTGKKLTNTNFEGRNLELSDVSEDQFKQTRQNFISSYVGANRTKFKTAEDAAGKASKEFSENVGKAFNEYDLKGITEQVKSLSLEALKMAKENSLAQALETASIEAQTAKQDIINFNEVLGSTKKNFLELKEKSFSLQNISNVFKGISEAAIDNAYNFSEYDKSIQKLNLSLSEIDASSVTKKLNLISETQEKLYSNTKSALGGQIGILQEGDLKNIYEKIQSDVVSGNEVDVSVFDPQKINRLGITQQYIKDISEQFKLQSKELANQTELEKNNLRIETYRTLVAQQTNAELETQNKNLELQQTKSEKIFEYSEKIRNSQNKIADLKFERSLVGATQTQRLSAEINQAPELRRRAQQESILNFQQDRIQSVQSLQNLIPSNLSSKNQFELKSKIQQSTEQIRSEKTIEKIGSKASEIYAEIASQINTSIEKESTERKGFIDSLKGTFSESTFTFSDSVVTAANQFKKIVIEAAEYPKQQENKNKISSLEKEQENRRNELRQLGKQFQDNANEFDNSENLDKQYLEETINATQNKIRTQQELLRRQISAAQQEIEKLQQEIDKPVIIAPTATTAISPFAAKPQENDTNSLPQITAFPIADGAAAAGLESARLDLESSLMEISNSTANRADELEKLIDPSRILADKFNQLRESIPSNIADLIFQAKSSISGEEISKANYDAETQRQLAGAQSSDEAAQILRDRQKKSVGQLFEEKLSKTEAEKSLLLKTTLVDASIEFKNNLIDGITQSIQQGQSLGDTLKSAALSFVQTLNKAMMSNAIDSLVGSGKNGSSGLLGSVFGYASGGQIIGGSGNKDDVPAMLMGGEFVINKKAAQKYGPDFLNALNSGSISGYAKGGSVQKGPQGNFFTPGQYGLGEISGSKNLLSFATQSSTTGSRDVIVNNGEYASLNLETESSRLTNFGRRTGPAAEALRSAKGQAFDLYLEDYKAKQELKKQQEEQDKAFKKQLLMSGLMLVGGAVVNAGITGFNNAYNASGAQGLARFGDGVGGIISGGNVGEGVMGGGLKNLFSGNFGLAFKNAPKVLKAGRVFGQENIFNGNTNEKFGTDPFNTNETFGYGPFDENGNYVEAWANNPEKWRKQNSNNSNVTRGPDNMSSVGTPLDDPRFVLPGHLQAKPNQRNFPKRATGGSIPATSGIDTVSTMLSGGEFIMNRAAAQNIGAGNLQALNAGAKSIPTEEKTEQLNDRLLSKLDELIEASGSASNITINVDSSGKSSETSDGVNPQAKQQFGRQVRDAVLKVIQEEKKLGGQLRR